MYRDAAIDEKDPDVAVDGGHVTALLISVVSVTVPSIMTSSPPVGGGGGAGADTSTPDSSLLTSDELVSAGDVSRPPLGSSMAVR